MPTFVQTWPFNYNAGGEPPQAGQIRLDTTDPTTVSKLWVRSPTSDNRDVSTLLFRIVPDGELYIQDRDNAANYLVAKSTGAPVDRGGYVELPVVYQDGSPALPTGAIDLYASVAFGAPAPPPVTGTGTPGAIAAWTDPTALGDYQGAAPPPPSATYVSLQQAADHLLLPIADLADTTDPRVRDLSFKLEAAQAIIFDYLKYDPTATVNPLTFPPKDPPPPDRNIQAAILIQLAELWGFRGDDPMGQGPDQPMMELRRDGGQLSPAVTNLLRRHRDPALA